MYRKSSFVSNLAQLRRKIEACENNDWRAAGLEAIEDTQPEFLSNLIPQDHPDRIGIVRYLTDEETNDAWRGIV